MMTCNFAYLWVRVLWVRWKPRAGLKRLAPREELMMVETYCFQGQLNLIIMQSKFNVAHLWVRVLWVRRKQRARWNWVAPREEMILISMRLKCNFAYLWVRVLWVRRKRRARRKWVACQAVSAVRAFWFRRRRYGCIRGWLGWAVRYTCIGWALVSMSGILSYL